MNLIYLTQRLPYAPNRGDRVRAYHELRVLASRHKVHLVSLAHDAEEERHAHDLDAIAASVAVPKVHRLWNLANGIRTLAAARPLTHALLDSRGLHSVLQRLVRAHRPELVLAYCSSMARFALEAPLDGIPVIMDMVDVDSEKWAAYAETSHIPMRWLYAREAKYLARFEGVAARKSRVTYVVNERERSSLKRLAGPSARVEVLPSGVDLAYLAPPAVRAHSSDVVFCGVMDYLPNEQGALWMAREVWPRVTAARPEARLILVGARPTQRVLHLPHADTSVVVTGSVADVRPYLWDGAVAAAPLLVARGMQNKVLEAVGAGLPTVVTPVVAAGLPVEVMGACRVASSPEAFAQAVLDLLALSPERRRELAAASRLVNLTWETQLEPLLREIDEMEAGLRGSA